MWILLSVALNTKVPIHRAVKRQSPTPVWYYLGECEPGDEDAVLEEGVLRPGDGGLPLEVVLLGDGPGDEALGRVRHQLLRLGHEPAQRHRRPGWAHSRGRGGRGGGDRGGRRRRRRHRRGRRRRRADSWWEGSVEKEGT